MISDYRETSKGSEFEIEAVLPNAIGQQKYLILALNFKKKQAGVGDISKAFTRAIQVKSPVILLSATGFSKSAHSFWEKEYKNMVSLVDGQDLK